MSVEFYSLPAHRLAEGMSTDDGQDVLDVTFERERDLVLYHTYTPSEDEEEDEWNQAAPDGRYAAWDELVDLAVFDGEDLPVTRIDGRQ